MLAEKASGKVVLPAVMVSNIDPYMVDETPYSLS